MYRVTQDIRAFNYGTITAIDNKDIPLDAAADSLNIDGTIDGILKGIPTDTELLINSSSIGKIKIGEFIEQDGVYDLIYNDSYDGKIYAIVDFYNNLGMQKKVDLGIGSSYNTTITKGHKNVRVGIENTDARWIGKIEHSLFGRPKNFNIVDASNTSPIVITVDTPQTFRNGDIVKISNVGGNTAANGIWRVINTNPTYRTFELEGSTGNGAYTGGGLATLYLYISKAPCYSQYLSSSAAGKFGLTVDSQMGTQGYFLANRYYEWAISFVYDGMQESPLVRNNLSKVTVTDAEYFSLVLEPYSANLHQAIYLFNKRLTAVNIYRADSTNNNVSGLGLFRKVASVDLENANQYANFPLISILDYGNEYTIGGGSKNPSEGTTYQENSGMPETLTDPRIDYGLATIGGAYHFVTRASIYTLSGNEKRTIYRSKEFRYDMFNYHSDFIVMPEPIQAIYYFEGKLYAFSSTKIYRINPELLYIEDVYAGAGAESYQSVTSNEYGMFWGNRNGAWVLSGSQITKISTPIYDTKNNGKSWKSFLFTMPLIVITDIKLGVVLFINEWLDNEQNKILAWAYNLEKKRWDVYNFGDYPSNLHNGVIYGKDGEVYLSLTNNKTYKLFSGNSTQQWMWETKDITFDDDSQKKSITKIDTSSVGTVNLYYSLDNGAYNSYTPGTLINQYAKKLKIKVEGQDSYLSSISITYRPLVGKR